MILFVQVSQPLGKFFLSAQNLRILKVFDDFTDGTARLDLVFPQIFGLKNRNVREGQSATR